MHAGAIWAHNKFRDALILKILSAMQTGSLTWRHEESGRYIMLSSSPGSEGERLDATESSLLTEISHRGNATVLLWLRGKPNNQLAVRIAQRSGGCVIDVDFDGLTLPESIQIAIELIHLSLSANFASSSLGLVIDGYLEEAAEGWEEFFFERQEMPTRTPYVVWYKADDSEAVRLYARERSWIVGVWDPGRHRDDPTLLR